MPWLLLCRDNACCLIGRMLCDNAILVMDCLCAATCRLHRVATFRLQDLLTADNVTRVFKGALLAADMALCAECVALILDEMPIGVGDDSEVPVTAADRSHAPGPSRAKRPPGGTVHAASLA